MKNNVIKMELNVKDNLIGIILCKGKNDIIMEYALVRLSNRLFA